MNRFYNCLAFAAFALSSATTNADAVVVPSAQETSEGNINNYFPFGYSQLDFRYQQVYAASEFSAPGAPLKIYGMALRLNEDSQPFSLTLEHVIIKLSTTTAAPDALSLTFANNIGPNESTVYDDSLTLSSAATGPVGGPLNFDVLIPFESPFVYDPAAGNLLLDVRTFPSAMNSTIYIFDAHNEIGDAVSRVWNGPVTATFGATNDAYPSLGLVTKFILVPEPSSAALSALGLAAIRSRVRSRRSAR